MAEGRRVFLLSRRTFCEGVASCAALGLAAGCALEGDGDILGTGPLSGGSEDAGPDEPDAGTSAPDAHVAASPDASLGPACATSTTDLGAPSGFAMGTATLFSSQNIFVCRDATGLYALSSRCTHQHCTLVPQTTRLHCNCHNANFDLNGGVVSGPIYQPLRHYLLCYNSTGHVAVDLAQTVTASTRLPVD